MSQLFEMAEKALLRRQQLPANFGPDAVRPSYDGLGLPNVAAQAVQWLAPGAPELSGLAPVVPFNPALLDEPEITRVWNTWQHRGPINHVVLLLMDALGYLQLKDLMKDGVAPNLAKLINKDQTFFVPLTSVYPSTTTTALTSAATAYSPAQHGVMATWAYVRQIGSVVDFIGYRPAVAPTTAPFLDTQLDPDTLVPVPNIYRRLEEAGIQVEIVNNSLYKGSSISRFTSAGSIAGQKFYNGYLTAADGFNQLRRRLEANSASDSKSFTYAYISTIDSSAHRYGPLSPNYQAELASLDFALNRELIEPLAGREDIVVLLVADHGQRRVEQDKILWLDDHPELTRMFQVPQTGESRVNYLHLKHGAEGAARQYIEQHFGEHFLTVSKAEATELGLFGNPGQPLGPECDDRIGDLLLVPKDQWLARQHISKLERVYHLVGTHGGLSQAEMLIPFLAYRF